MVNRVSEAFIVDISHFNRSTTEQSRDMLGRYGITTSVLLMLAVKVFNEYSPGKSRGFGPPMMPQHTATTVIATAEKLQMYIKSTYELKKNMHMNNMNFTMFRDAVATAIFQMYYAVYSQLSLMYNGILSKYKLEGALLEMSHFQLLTFDRVRFSIHESFAY